MVKVFVDYILSDLDKGLYAWVESEKKVKSNIPVIFDEQEVFGLLVSLRTSAEEAIHTWKRLNQFIVRFDLYKNKPHKMFLFDCKSDEDIAHNLYRQAGMNKWEQVDKDIFMSIFFDIVNNPQDDYALLVKDNS